ncbi:DNA sulfur modification protein DndD [Sphingobium sp. ZW T5_29]|uniref:DNA sulfur modification protein DndD n=1 Tax=Sphingobium sp. ZW T5_29 TaxID=3378077 RepID=UPI0038546892
MIIDQLTLHDFGQYGGRVVVDLTPPSPEQPIILFGGLNGAGKTTLLDAIQLCLYGQLARPSRREGMSYEQYLEGSIHRGNGATSAMIELRFRHMSHGEEQIYHVKRSWRRTPKTCKDQLEVIRNHRFDAMATDHWAEQVEEFLPSRIAHLFLFDGEQIEAYADPRSSAGLIETAVYNLLGLDLVEKLGSDLSVIERRRRMEVRPQEEQDQLKVLELRREELRERIDIVHAAHAKREADLTRMQDLRARLEERFRKEGGHLYERRGELERTLSTAEAHFRSTERTLRDAAAGASPLLLVGPLLQRTAQQSRVETASAQALATDQLLSKRDAEIIEAITKQKPSSSVLKALSDFLREDRASRRNAVELPRLGMSDLGRDRLRELTEAELNTARAMLPSLLDDQHRAWIALEDARNQVAAVPTAEALTALSSERDDLITRAAVLQTEQKAEGEQLDRLRRDLERAQAEISRFTADDKEAQLAQDDRARVLLHVSKVRETLDKFRDAVIRRHLARIEALVLDSFQQLLRKKTLVANLRIDPETFHLALTGRDGNPLPPDRLSAGERQLLATSVLWGLARASGRPLPTVIDTPLGRLDSSHRRRLVTHYFPLASHQVILLSTDEEIAGGYFEALKPFVGRAYHLQFDEERGTTSVEPGYFSEVNATSESIHVS